MSSETLEHDAPIKRAIEYYNSHNNWVLNQKLAFLSESNLQLFHGNYEALPNQYLLMVVRIDSFQRTPLQEFILEFSDVEIEDQNQDQDQESRRANTRIANDQGRDSDTDTEADYIAFEKEAIEEIFRAHLEIRVFSFGDGRIITRPIRYIG
jgi:hypothetical protein